MDADAENSEQVRIHTGYTLRDLKELSRKLTRLQEEGAHRSSPLTLNRKHFDSFVNSKTVKQ